MSRLARFAFWFLIFVILVSSGCAHRETTERTITVVGMADIDVPPDHLVAYLSVATVHMDPVEAKKKNDSTVRSILSFFNELGIPSKDIATGYVSLEERYTRGRQGEQVFQGFEAETSIQATVRDLDLHDRLIEGCLGLGLNRILGITFRSTEIVQKHREARKRAIRAAREKAEYLAEELGHTVGPAVSIMELRSDSTRRWSGGPTSNNYVIELSGGEFSPDIETQTVIPKSIKVREQVQVVFRLQDDS